MSSPTSVSFEFYPPKTELGQKNLLAAASALDSLNPEFMSVTYGASGSDRSRTEGIVKQLSTSVEAPIMPHLTCGGHSKTEIENALMRYKRLNIDHILALGGDTPGDGREYYSDYSHAEELVVATRAVDGFRIGVAAHPEGHPESVDIASDTRYLAQKLKIADFAITQFFFNSDDYERLVNDLAKLGVDKPVIPGILPINNVTGLRKMADMNNTKIPTSLDDRLTAAGNNSDEVEKIGIEMATDLSDKLLSIGAPGIHLYTMNKADPSKQVIENLCK